MVVRELGEPLLKLGGGGCLSAFDTMQSRSVLAITASAT